MKPALEATLLRQAMILKDHPKIAPLFTFFFFLRGFSPETLYSPGQ